MGFSLSAQSYPLTYHSVDGKPALLQQLSLSTNFPSSFLCREYLNKLTGVLQAKGYITASLDTIRLDPAGASVSVYLGEIYKWARLDLSKLDAALLNSTGWKESAFAGKPLAMEALRKGEERMMDQLENNGYPFARIYLDSIRIEQDLISARLKVDKGILYLIDSIRVYGNAKISREFLERYLEMPRGMTYSREKLIRVNAKLRELTYIEEEKPFDLSMLASGSVLNLYLRQKKSSQVNFIIGFLPNNDQLSSKKLLLTGEANILLKNAFNGGETLGLNWQQLQVRSPRLNLYFNYPYLFHSSLGADLRFDILRKDSSYVNIDLQAGAQYALNTNQSAKLFIQQFSTILNAAGINAQQVIAERKLPAVGDVSSFNVGVDYLYNNTDYRLNPRKGNEFQLTSIIGNKKVKKNSEIVDLKDPNDPSFDFDRLYDTIKLSSYQFRAKLVAAHYFPLANGRSTVKTAINAGVFQSASIFLNELFQLGGYKLLRGFDEESQYLTHYAIATTEFRYLVGQNSYFYALLDGGWGRNNMPAVKRNYSYIGTGLGLAFETKAGIFNFAWAIGKRNDAELDLRRSKIHFGFVNYF